MRVPILLVVAALTLAGCAGPGTDGYPSLLPRPIESIDTAEPMRTPPPAVPDPALDQEIATFVGLLESASTTFSQKAADVEQLASRARGSPAGSDAWIAAQVALAELDVLRAQTNGLAADIERRIIERGASGAVAYSALDELYRRATAQAAAETNRVATIEAMLATA